MAKLYKVENEMILDSNIGKDQGSTLLRKYAITKTYADAIAQAMAIAQLQAASDYYLIDTYRDDQEEFMTIHLKSGNVHMFIYVKALEKADKK